MTPEEILHREFEKLKAELIANHRVMGYQGGTMEASGDWIRSVENRTDRLSASIWANDYTEQLTSGREPGTFPPISAIEKWIEDKGLQPRDEALSISSFAFLIARKIAQQGTTYFEQGGTDLVDSVITPERIQSIVDKVSVFYVNDFVQKVTNELKVLAAA